MPSLASLVAIACLLSAPRCAPPPAVGPSRAVATPLSTAAGDAKAGGSDLAPIRIGPILLTGYAQFDGLVPLGDHDASQNGTFRIRRARMYASGDVLPKIGFTISGDLTDSMPMRDVYVTLRHIGAANIKAGQFIAPYSLERLTSTKELEAIDRVIDHLVPSRDMGVMVFNAKPFLGQLLYSAAVINGTGQNARDTNDAKDYVGRMVWRVPQLSGVSIGVNGAAGRQPLGMRTRWGADLNIDRGDFRIATEYTQQTQEWGGHTGHGFYVLARRRFRPAASRSDFAEAVVRVVEIRDPNELIGGVPGVLRREVQTGGNYYFSRNVRIMADAFVPFKRLAGAPRASIITRVQFGF